MKSHDIEKIESNLCRLDALFAAIAGMSICVERIGQDTCVFIGDNLKMLRNLNYLAEIKDGIMEEIENDLVTIKQELEAIEEQK